MIIQIAEAKALLKEIKEANESLQWKNEMKIRELESIIKKKDKAIDDLNASLFKVTQESMDKDKTIEALQKDIKGIQIKSITEIAKHENELSELRKANTEMAKLAMDRYFEIKRLKREIENKKVFLLNDEGEPIKEFTLTGTLKLVEETTKEKLEVGKWYHTDDFTLENLQKLLPIGTTVMVEQDVAYDNIETEPPSKGKIRKVEKITTRFRVDTPLIDVGEVVSREWFKIIEEN